MLWDQVRRLPWHATGAFIHKEDLDAAMRERDDMLRALEAFVDQATKLSGFPQTYVPYSGALVVARAAIAKARGK